MLNGKRLKRSKMKHVIQKYYDSERNWRRKMIMCNCGYDMKYIYSNQEDGEEPEVAVWIYQCKRCGAVVIKKSDSVDLRWEEIGGVR
jgi:hypothetical protein